MLNHKRNVSPHLVSTKSTGNILCGEACERPINVGFCSHAIAVALYTESFESFEQLKLKLSSHQRSLIRESLEEKSLFREGCGLCPYQIAKKNSIQHTSTYTNFIKHFTSAKKHRS